MILGQYGAVLVGTWWKWVSYQTSAKTAWATIMSQDYLGGPEIGKICYKAFFVCAKMIRIENDPKRHNISVKKNTIGDGGSTAL